jgi:hypothetical protein
MGDRPSGLLLAPVLVAATLGLFPTELHAQTCTLDAPLPAAIVEAATSTRFLPSGGDGEILVRRKYSAAAAVRVFEVPGPEPVSWKENREYPVISVKPPPERSSEGSKTYLGYGPTDSSIVRFIVPSRKNSWWRDSTFVVRICDKDAGDALALVQIPISPPIGAKIITIVFLALVYLLFAGAVARVRGKPHPLATKYPALTRQRMQGWLENLDPVVLTANAFNKGSIQKLQVLLFSFLVSGMVLALVLRLGVLSDLSVTVALLLGISAVGAAVAQKTTASRDRLSFDSWAWLVQKKILPIHEESETGPRWSDLVMTNREFDIYKLQTLIFSVVVAVALLASGEESLSSFAVPETLLGILGLSQVVYISGTLASPPSIAELDEAIKRLSEMEIRLQTVVARGVDTDEEGKVPPPPTPPAPPAPATLDARIANAANAMKSYKKMADQVEIMLESTLGVEVSRNLLDPKLS